MWTKVKFFFYRRDFNILHLYKNKLWMCMYVYLFVCVSQIVPVAIVSPKVIYERRRGRERERIPQNVDLIVKECSKWKFLEVPPKNIFRIKIKKKSKHFSKSKKINLENFQKIWKNVKISKILKNLEKSQNLEFFWKISKSWKERS